MGATANRYGTSFWGDEIVLKLWWRLHNSANILKAIKLYTSNGCVVCKLYLNRAIRKKGKTKLHDDINQNDISHLGWKNDCKGTQGGVPWGQVMFSILFWVVTKINTLCKNSLSLTPKRYAHYYTYEKISTTKNFNFIYQKISKKLN